MVGGKGPYHWAAVADIPDVSEWSAKCGWQFGFSDVKRKQSMPRGVAWDHVSGRCFPELKAYKYSLKVQGKKEEVTSDSAS